MPCLLKEVVQTQDHVLLPLVTLEVEARRLVLGKDGYEDAAHTDDNDPAVVHARSFTKFLPDIAEQVPVVAELFEACKALVLAIYLLERKDMGINPGMLRKFLPKSVVANYNKVVSDKSFDKYPLTIPTLRKHRTKSMVSPTLAGANDPAAGITTENRTQSMFGGVDLVVKPEDIKERSSSSNVLHDEHAPIPFPLMVH